MFHYDLIVIGAGPGGYTAALRAAKRGWKTAVIERREVGGTCLNRGCIPTKTLLHASEIAAGIRGGRFGIEAQQVRLDMAAMLTRKRQVSAQLSGGIEAMLRAEKVELLQGNATVLGPSQVRLTGENEQVLTARHILLATGAVPARPPIPGLDLPEVSLVAILDADKEGFLRSETSLIQTIGRAARNADGLVIMYADEITPSMRAAIDETERRRSIQDAYNQEHGIVPKTIIKGVREILEISKTAEEDTLRAHKKRKLTEQERAAEIAKLEKEMREASKMLEFEYAAVLRDRIIELRGEK